MDPNVYFAYLCLINNGSQIYRHFTEWQINQQPYFCGTLFGLMQNIRSMHIIKYRRLRIYEAEKTWIDFDAQKFMEFLGRLGFER